MEASEVSSPVRGHISLLAGACGCGCECATAGPRGARVRERGTASAAVTSLPSVGDSLRHSLSKVIPSSSRKQERNASLALVLLLSCSRARKYYW